jgi:uncharacterized protein (TIGR02996 family)
VADWAPFGNSRSESKSRATRFECAAQGHYENPDDTSLRLVYGDALTEQGDARGEFIALQCSRSEKQKPSPRERALLKNHSRQWLGDLDFGIRKQGLVYQRGFLSEARECGTEGQQASPMWATVEALEFDALTWGPRAVRFANRSDLRALRCLYLRSADAAEIQQVHSRVKTLGLFSALGSDVETVLSRGVFPGLEVLELAWPTHLPYDVEQSVGPIVKEHEFKTVRLRGQELGDLGAVLRALRSVSSKTEVEIVDGSGLSERLPWCLSFAGPLYDTVKITCSSRDASPHFARQRLLKMPREIVQHVEFEAHIDQTPFTALLAQLHLRIVCAP